MKQLLILVSLTMISFVAINAQDGNLPPPMKSTKVDPIVIRYDKNILTVSFSQNLGNIAISVIDNQGQYVYLNQTDSSLSIKTESWSNGTYIVSVRNKDGILKEILFYKEE